MKKILLTGAKGMVGQNILNHDSAKLFNWLTPSRNELDLTSQNIVELYIHQNHPDFVIHAAGMVGGIQANINSPIDFLVNNMRIGMNVIHSSMLAGVPKLLNLGSSCMYPRNAPNPLQEKMVLSGEFEPTNEGYALAKVASAKLCQYISQHPANYLYKTAIPSNLYGHYDDFGLDRSHMIPAVIDKLHRAKANNTNNVEIWGDGMSRREFMFAHDLADFIFYTLKNFDLMPEILNIGVGTDLTINEYYRIIAKEVGYEGSFSYDLAKPSGMNQKLLDISNLDEFGWCASTSLAQGIKKTYQHYLEFCL
jgi:GDP-L-fucose synthase